MLLKYYLVALDSDRDIDRAFKAAADYQIQALYKIGFYGKIPDEEYSIEAIRNA